MGITIESAYLGDERGRVNVLSSLQNKVTPDGYVSVPVDSGLIPMLQVGGETKLTKDEEREAKEKAVEACGGPNDPTCIEQKKMELQRQRLDEKELETQSKANIIKGRKLTVTVNENGKKSTFEIPEGQTFEFGKKKSAVPPIEIGMSNIQNITVGGTVLKAASIIGTILLTFGYVFSVLATFKAFNDTTMVIPKYIATACAVVFPYFGALGAFAFLVLRSWIEKMPPAPVA